jgi:hypothetical protein
VRVVGRNRAPFSPLAAPHGSTGPQPFASHSRWEEKEEEGGREEEGGGGDEALPRWDDAGWADEEGRTS